MDTKIIEPRHVAVGADGTLYFTNGNVIYKLTKAGVLNLFADNLSRFENIYNYPSCVSQMVVGLDGNLYYTDSTSFTVRCVRPDGQVCTLAGSPGVREFKDGQGDAAHFYKLDGLCKDSTGMLYVCDSSIIRRIDLSGVVTSCPGLPRPCAYSRDGIAGVGMMAPSAMVSIGDGEFLFVESISNRLRHVNKYGAITTVAGERDPTIDGLQFPTPGAFAGNANNMRFSGPYGLAMDAERRLYIADTGNGRLCIGTPTAIGAPKITTHPTSPPPIIFVAGITATLSIKAEGEGLRYQWERSSCLETGNPWYAITDDAMYSGAESDTLRIAQLPASCVTWLYRCTVTNSAGFDISQPASINVTEPFLYIDPQPTDVCATEGYDAAFQVGGYSHPSVARLQWQCSRDGGVIWENLSEGSGYEGVHNLRLYVTAKRPMHGYLFRCLINIGAGDVATAAAKLSVLPATADLAFKTEAILDDGIAISFGRLIKDIAIDSKGQAYCLRGNAIYRLSSLEGDGHMIINHFVQPGYWCVYGWYNGLDVVGGSLWVGSDYGYGGGDGSLTDATFWNPQSIAMEPETDAIIVADSQNHTIRRITPDGTVSTLAGKAGEVGAVDGSLSAARFYCPEGVAVDKERNIWIADTGNHCIRRISHLGVVSTLAGLAGDPGNVDGRAGAARFNLPSRIALDAEGNAYVIDQDKHTVRKITPQGEVTTIAGKANETGYCDGPGTDARFTYLSAITVDGQGSIYVADAVNDIIRRIGKDGVVQVVAGLLDQYFIDDEDVTHGYFSDGGGAAARFCAPSGLTCDGAGNLYVVEEGSLTVRRSTPARPVIPVILTHPQDAPALSGGSVQYHIEARSTGGLTYQWQRQLNDTHIWYSLAEDATYAGTQTTTLTVNNINASMAGDRFRCLVSDGGLVLVLSREVQLTSKMLGEPSRYTETTLGSPVSFNVAVSSLGGVRYQWYRNADACPLEDGDEYSGVNTATLTVKNPTISGEKDLYFCIISDPGAQWDPAHMQRYSSMCSYTINCSQFAALSVRAAAGTSDQSLIMGFVFAGEDKAKNMLIRGVGPGLAKADTSLASVILPDPAVVLTELGANGWATVDYNDDWSGSSTELAAFAATGAGALDYLSKDAVLLRALPGRVYTAMIQGGETNGVALAEVYDAALADKSRRLTALSVRNQVGTGSNILIVGFVITGKLSKRVIVRGVGPGIADSVHNYLEDPQLQIFKYTNGSWTLVTENDDWGGDAETAALFKSAGMGKLDAESADAALVVELPPGVYTALLRGAQETTGVGMVEVYEAPEL